MEKATFDSPIFSLTPFERIEMEQKAAQAQIHDPDVQDMVDGYGGRFILGNRSSLTGVLGWYLGEAVANPFTDEEDAPLNLYKTKSEVDPLKDDLTFGLDNNIEGIVDGLQGVPFDNWDYILSAKTYGNFKDRLRFVKAGLPEAQAQGVGSIVGTVGDTFGLAAISMAAEPLILTGMGVETTLAGRAAASVSGRWKMHQTIAESATEAASTISRTSLAARYTAFGIAEEVAYQSAKNGLDPTYSPEAGQVIQDIVVSAAANGLIGGLLFGRQFAAERIAEEASKLRRSKTDRKSVV